MIREILAALGYDSERALSGDAAVDLLDTDDNFDLVISDMVMPGRRSGLDLVQEIGERWPTLPTMLMTGYSDAAIAAARENIRSEEHTSELKSLMRISYAVFCLKKKKTQRKLSNTVKRKNNR